MAEMNESSMDYNEHRETYESFLRFTAVATIFVLIQLVGLAIGGLGHSWFLAGFWIFVGVIASAMGLAIKSLGWKPGAVVLVIMLATLLMVTH